MDVSAEEDARVALLARLVDHAPLFPPASLSMEQALDEDDRARRSPSSFMLARFVCPASRVRELPEPWRGISAVLDGDLPSGPAVEAVEAPPGADLAPLAVLAPEVYVEVMLDDTVEARLDVLAAAGLRAKVRCGGPTVPDGVELARFVRACAERGLVFKATAGLHHALRTNVEHGFLNLLAAVVFGDEESALVEDAPDAFALDSEAFTWRDRTAGPDELARVRRERLHSIGSCSFFEPVEGLERLGVLPL